MKVIQLIKILLQHPQIMFTFYQGLKSWFDDDAVNVKFDLSGLSSLGTRVAWWSDSRVSGL